MTGTVKKILVTISALAILGIYVVYEQSSSASATNTGTSNTQTVTQAPAADTSATADASQSANNIAGATASQGTADANAAAATSNTSSSPAKTPATPIQAASQPAAETSGRYRDGVYTGSAVSALYGTVQLRVTIANGEITDIAAIQSPGERGRSESINQNALPILRQEAIKAQSAAIDSVSGASDTSAAYKQSLASALAQA